MNSFEPYKKTYEESPEFKTLTPKKSRRSKPKMNSRTSKKNRMLLRKWENKIIELNNKINEHIKNQEKCKKQSLEKTLESVEKIKIRRRSNKKNKKAKNPKKNKSQPNFSFFGNQEQKEEAPVKEQEPAANTMVEYPVQEPAQTLEEPPSQEPTNTSTNTEQQEPMNQPVTPANESSADNKQNTGIISSVTDAAKSAAESVGLSTPSEPQQKKVEGGKTKKRRAKR